MRSVAIRWRQARLGWGKVPGRGRTITADRLEDLKVILLSGSPGSCRMSCVADWLGAEMEVAVSGGGVLAAVDPWRNVVRGDVTPWPPPELLQKLYQSRQA